MLKIIKTVPQHFYDIEIQEAQFFCKEQFNSNPEYVKILSEQSVTWTGIAEDGAIIGMMGLLFRHENNAEGWAIFSPHIKKYLKQIIKEVRSFLKSYSHIKRIQCTASLEFPEAHKLLTKSFGFKVEGILESWDCFGNDHLLYTIINNNLEWEIR